MTGVLTGKPEKYICVALNTDTPMSFAGSEEPAAWITFYSIGSPWRHAVTCVSVS